MRLSSASLSERLTKPKSQGVARRFQHYELLIAEDRENPCLSFSSFASAIASAIVAWLGALSEMPLEQGLKGKTSDRLRVDL